MWVHDDTRWLWPACPLHPVGQALADMGGENRCLQVFSVESSALGTRVGNGQGVVTSVCISLVNTALPSSSL